MEMNINVFSDFVRNAEILWIKGFMSVPQVARSSGLFKVVPIPQNTGNTREFSEIETEEYARKKGESAQAKRARIQQGYTKIGRLYRVALDEGISYEMRTQGKYLEIQQKLLALGRVAPNRLDLDLTHRVTFCTVTSYTDMDGDTVDLTVGDGFQLAYTAHTVRGGSATFRNRLANNPQLSWGSLEAMRKMRVENCINQFGQKMTCDDDMLFTGDDPVTVDTARVVLRAQSQPDQANSAIPNAQLGILRHVILPRLATDANGNVDSTKAKYWGVASSQSSSAYLGVHEEPHMKAPTAPSGTSAEDFSTEDWNFGVAGGWMIVVVGASWFGFSSGNATA